MPQNVEAERSVLGAILLDQKSLTIAAEKLKPEDFFHDHHIHIFYAMLAMADKGIAIDLVNLSEELQKAGELELVGGASYISQLMDGMPRISNIAFYANIIKEKAILRGLIHATHAIQEQALDASDDPGDILNRAREFIDFLGREQSKTGLIGLDKIVSGNYERISRVFESEHRITGLATGYDILDMHTAGLQPSEFIVLAARPSMGKSSLALNLVENIARKQTLPIAVFSLEMSKESLLLRLLSSIAKVSGHKFRTGHLNAEDRANIVRALGDISQLPIWIDDSSTNSIQEVSAKARRLKDERGLVLVVIDYIQLLSSSKRSGSRQEEVSDISRALKALAKDLAVPVIGLSQLTRAPEQENRRPMLSDLRSSGSIEQDSDVVLFIHRPNFYKKSSELESEMDRAETDLIIAKQRNGPIADVKMVFLEQITRFEQRAPEMFEE